MLGSDQWLWLEESVRKPADLRVIVSSVQVIPDEHPFEKWGNFPLEQQRFLKLLCEAPLTSTVLLSGVRHSSEISAWSCPSGRTLLELTSSSLNVPIVGKRRFPNRFRVGSEVLEANVGFLVVTARASGLSEVTGQILGTNGQILDQMTIIDKKGTL
jgi:alkaline phosphatase D